jgi:hypothetical protein
MKPPRRWPACARRAGAGVRSARGLASPTTADDEVATGERGLAGACEVPAAFGLGGVGVLRACVGSSVGEAGALEELSLLARGPTSLRSSLLEPR